MTKIFTTDKEEAMSIVNLSLKVLKIGVSAFIKNDLVKEIFGELADAGVDKVEKFFAKYLAEINCFLSLEDEEMEKQSIPQEKREDIRENIKEFIRGIKIDEIAKKCGYNGLDLGNVLADEYRKLYEQNAEFDYIYYQRVLCGLANNVLESIKNSENFERDRILDCYNLLVKFQEQRVADEKWKSEIVTIIRELLSRCESRIESPFEQIVNGLPEKRSSNSPLHYLYANIDIYGREEELQLLEDFIDSPGKLLFWAILGPGGIGKSKLAYSFLQKHKNNYEWKMAFLSSQKLKEVLSLAEWEYPQNLLLVIDYAGAVAEELGEWIQKMITGAEYRTKKIRLLFLERQDFRKIEDVYVDEEEYIAPDWYKRLCRPCSEGVFADRESIQEYQYLFNKCPCMLSLRSLSSQAHISIMDNYAKAIGKETLCEKDKIEIFEFVENSLLTVKGYCLEVTPLYILFVTDAALNGNAFRDWNIERLMQYVYERDYSIWNKRIKEKKLLVALMEILIYTTIVKEWEIGKSLFGPLKETEKIINEYRMKEINDPAYEWIHVLTGRISDKKFTPVMSALEPDLVGEYYVLKRFSSRSDEEIKCWCKILLENPLACKEFFMRCIQDYGKEFWDVLLKIFSGMNIVLNENNEGSILENQIQAVAFLWLQYYQNVLPTRSIEPRDRIKEFCEKWKGHSQEAAELYTIVFFKNVEIRGSQKKKKFVILEQLYKRWSDSRVIAEVYVNLLAALVEYCYGSGYPEKGNGYVRLLQAMIDKWGTYDEEVAISCAHALEEIIPLQYEAGSKEQVVHNIDVLEDLLNNWENESFALYFIVVQGDMAITQGAMSELKECEQTLIILCETVKRWGIKNERIAWRAIDTITKVFARLQNKIQEDIRKKLLITLAEVANNCAELSNGIIWHCTKALDRIADMENVTFEEIEYISIIQKKCYQKLEW